MFIKRLAIISILCAALLGLAVGSVAFVKAQDDGLYTIDVLVTKVTTEKYEGALYLNIEGWYPINCSYHSVGKMSHTLTHISGKEHKIRLSVSYPYAYEECVRYVKFGYYVSVGSISEYENGKHLFWVNTLGIYKNLP